MVIRIIAFSALSAFSTVVFIVCMMLDRDYFKDIFSN